MPFSRGMIWHLCLGYDLTLISCPFERPTNPVFGVYPYMIPDVWEIGIRYRVNHAPYRI
jgi:hypothetical protein